jgi:hypothetical protein
MAAKPPSKSFFDYGKKEAVRIATSNLFIDTTTTSEEFMTNVIFEDIGGNEMLQTQTYNFLVNPDKSNILNLATVLEVTSPRSLFKSSDTYNSIFNQFEIELSSKIPAVGNYQDNNSNVYFFGGTTIYGDSVSPGINSILIEFINLSDDEEIEVQFMSIAVPISDTI